MSSVGTTGLDALREQESRYIMGTYARQPLALVRGEGVRVWDSEGNELLDMVAGIAVNVLGHAPAAVRAALERQSSLLLHVSNLYYTEPMVEAARRLVETAFAARVFFCNSGAEANEGAIKIARKWGQRNRDGAHRIICMRNAFHGRTLATLAATGNQRYIAPFAPVTDGFVHVDFDDADAVAAAVDDRTVAVMLEPVQGETGIHPVRDETLRALRALCDERGLLLILDEVQTGMGRTGRWWAHQHAGVTPDVMTVAKGLGGGVPIGAILAAPRADVLEPGDHGCTFGGNPLVTAVAAEVLRTIDERGLVAHAARTGEHLQGRLRELGAAVVAVRGRGLMVAADLDADLAPQVVRAGLGSGVIVNATGPRTLRLVPPLILTEAEADEAVARLGVAIRRAGNS
ncbi:MAG TPA: acetylornithine transaminase [Candidatus Dormibacteraeota bacterium]|jgi:predicted acetylornithine/succinylornithine family transaminase|nr:acetylornithine transaminase [Candidatus Dormibacteraeota bacterium]